MDQASIIIPAYNASEFIHRSVVSVLNQSHKNFEIIIIADDEFDYQSFLTDKKINDSRIVYKKTGSIGLGASKARNIGIRAASSDIIAILDADDTFHPEKLKTCMNIVKHHHLISCALNVLNSKSQELRQVGDKREEGILEGYEYKTVNFSMDSMIIFNKTSIPVYYDEQLKCWNDFDFIIKCLSITKKTYHIPYPFHKYYKQQNSISNNVESHNNYRAVKTEIMGRLQNNYYALNDKISRHLINFVDKSLKAEDLFEKAKMKNKDVLFEDVIEPLLTMPKVDQAL